MKIDLAPAYEEAIRKILKEHIPDAEVWAFGSRIKWIAKDTSDLDLVIVLDKKIPSKVMTLLKLDFEDSDIPFKVDILNWQGISEEFQGIIRDEYVVFQKSHQLKINNQILNINHSFEERSISECAATEPYSTQIGPFGNALKSSEYVEKGVPVLRGVNVNQGRFYDDGYVFITSQKADSLKKFESESGDVLLVHKGTLGKIGLMPKKPNTRNI